jgi:hypothetical protein
MLRWYRFYVSLRLGGGWTEENLLLRCVDACQSCSCGAGTAARELLQSVDARQRGQRAAPAGRGRPEEPFWQILAALKGRVFRGTVLLRASDAIPPREQCLSRWACGRVMPGKIDFWSKTSNSKNHSISRDNFNKLKCVFRPSWKWLLKRKNVPNYASHPNGAKKTPAGKIFPSSPSS